MRITLWLPRTTETSAVGTRASAMRFIPGITIRIIVSIIILKLGYYKNLVFFLHD